MRSACWTAQPIGWVTFKIRRVGLLTLPRGWVTFKTLRVPLRMLLRGWTIFETQWGCLRMWRTAWNPQLIVWAITKPDRSRWSSGFRSPWHGLRASQDSYIGCGLGSDPESSAFSLARLSRPESG